MNDLYSLSFISYGGPLMESGAFLIFFPWKGGGGCLLEGGGLIWEGGLNRGFTALFKIFCLLSPRSPSRVWGTRHRTNFRPVEFKFDRTLCSHRTVQYFRSVHTEIVTVRRLNFRSVKVVLWEQNTYLVKWVAIVICCRFSAQFI